jgi:polar amino acid transport system ATP-binding protein
MQAADTTEQDIPLIAACGLTKAYGAIHALNGVDLSVARGEVIVIIGPSGSGKSTLIRCLNGLEQADAGEIRIGGRTVQAHSPRMWREVRQRIGMVFQDYTLFPHMTVLRNIMFAPVRSGRRTPDAGRDDALRLLDRVGLREKADAFPAHLSGGQLQRVAIVRALAMEPMLMLLDEITSALDPELVSEVLNIVRDLAADGMTMLLATHEMGFARDVASKVCFLFGGVVHEEGPPEQIFDNPTEERTRAFLKRIIEAGRL